MTEKQKRPYEEVHLMTSLFLSLFLSAAWSLTISIENLQISKKNKAKYQEEMELYKQQKDEEAENLKKGEEEQMKIQKHEALQLLKKKEKTENIIKVLPLCHHKFVGIVGFKTYSAANLVICGLTIENQGESPEEEEAEGKGQLWSKQA